MLTKLEAIEILQKEYTQADIILEENKYYGELHDIAKAFGVHAHVEEFTPDINRGKYSVMPHHTEECNEHYEQGVNVWRAWNEKTTGKESKCPCWELSIGTGISLASLVNIIAAKYDIHTGMIGRGFNYRAQLEQLKKTVEQETIHITTGKMVSIPLDDKPKFYNLTRDKEPS